MYAIVPKKLLSERAIIHSNQLVNRYFYLCPAESANNWVLKHHLWLISGGEDLLREIENGDYSNIEKIIALVHPAQNRTKANRNNPGRERLSYVRDQLKKYAPGEIPANSFDSSIFTAKEYLKLLTRIAFKLGKRPDETQLKDSLAALMEFEDFLSAPASDFRDHAAFCARIDDILNRFEECCRNNARLFTILIERFQQKPDDKPATKGDVAKAGAKVEATVEKAKVEVETEVKNTKSKVERVERKVDAILDTATIVKDTVERTDRRTKKMAKERGRKRRFDVKTQETIFGYWDRGQQLEAIRELSNKRPKHEDVFNYFRKELKALGVVEASTFTKIIQARSKRICRSNCKRK